MRITTRRVLASVVTFALGLPTLGQSSTPPPGMSVRLGERVTFQPGPYRLTEDSMPQEGVPRGVVTAHVWDTSAVFPGTTHEYWVYVPAQYDPEGDEPAAVMVFQDGPAYFGEDSRYRVEVVLDNLIARGEVPVIIAVFIKPGYFEETGPDGETSRRGNRSVEYDTPDDTYARFLIEEILPEVGRDYRLTEDPEMRAICGASSGGVAAFKTAWHRPDAFRKVISTIGSFVNIRGGHVYPAIIRKEEVRPIRVFLQGGMNDLDNRHGSWWLANQAMARSLAFEDRYDYWFVAGDGRHNGQHGGAVFPDAMRWLWRGWDEAEGEPESQ